MAWRVWHWIGGETVVADYDNERIGDVLDEDEATSVRIAILTDNSFEPSDWESVADEDNERPFDWTRLEVETEHEMICAIAQYISDHTGADCYVDAVEFMAGWAENNFPMQTGDGRRNMGNYVGGINEDVMADICMVIDSRQDA